MDKKSKFDDANLKPGMVPLGHGEYAYVDLDDFDQVMRYSWRKHTNGYAHCSAGYLHRMVMKNPVGMEIDHINRKKLDCKKSNLRACFPWQNRCNRDTKPHSSKYRGVVVRGQKFLAFIKIEKKQKYLGNFDDEVEAAKRYDEMALANHGEFAFLNFEARPR